MDMIINSHVQTEYANVLAFRLNSVTGYRIPSINVRKSTRSLKFASRVSEGEKRFAWPFELNKWYRIVMEQKEVSGKVRMLEKI